MTFLPFDLDHHLEQYNQQTQTPKTRQDYAFLQALSPESVKALALANDLLQKSSSLSAIPREIAGLTLLEKVKTQLNENDYKGARASLNEISLFIENDDLQSWYIEQQRRLSNPDLWEQIRSNPKTNRLKNRLAELENQWLSPSAEYSAHSISALWFVANNITALYENYHRFATLELKTHRYRLPRLIRTAYETHLKNEKTHLKQFKETLCQAMLNRLQVASESGDITNNDAIQSTAQWLAKNKLIKQQHGLPTSRRHDLTPEHFEQFVTYINQFGSEQQIKSLPTLAIFSSNDQFTTLQSDKSIVIVPAELVRRNLVPSSRPILYRLFENRYFRFDFFQKNLWLFCSLRNLAQFPMMTLTLEQSVNHIRLIGEKLSQANQEIQGKNFRGISRLINYKTILLKQAWQPIMAEVEAVLLKKKIESIKILHTKVKKSDSSFFVDHFILTLLDEITEALAHIHLPPKECEDFYAIKTDFLNTKIPLLDLPGVSPQEEYSQEFQEEPEATLPDESQDQPSTNPFDVDVKPTNTIPTAPDRTVFGLLNNIKLLELDTANLQEMISGVKSSIKANQLKQHPSDISRLHNLLDKFFIEYLQKSVSLKTLKDYEEYRERLILVEDFLQVYGADHIKTRIEALTEIREKPNASFLLQLKCRSYLASYQQKIAPYLIANSVILKSERTLAQAEPLASQLSPQTIGRD